MKRYQKNILIKGFGEKGQERLLNSKAVVTGLGGLGSAVAFYLAASGIGELIIIDNDTVNLKDLQRQILYDEESVGMNKTDAAAKKLKKLNSDIKITAFDSKWGNIEKDLLTEVPDIIVDCVDNNKTKFALNDFSVQSRIPFIHCGVVGMKGQITTIIPGKTGCLRCFFPDIVPEDISSDIEGILGPVAGNMGTLEAIEAIKYLTNSGDCLENKILFTDYKENTYEIVKYGKRKNCICSIDEEK
ncbi:ThiF family adenylyltransferase [Elusimicrobiota bacterium]